ncbi:MAG: gliding motility-associated C-terminal domain-containing protein [Crocinitomicaceae bacterium]|nr:gliding motility-associated C-terminal domain-containing protein [Crocinitomicaceae bacterium]
MKTITLFASLLFAIIGNAQNDLTINPTILSPLNGCYLSSTEDVEFYIINTNTFPYSGTIQVGYILNSGTPVIETISVFMGSGATYDYTFPIPDDFSACQEHDLVAWVYDVNDPNHINDTINVTVISDCAPVVGWITGPDTLCFGNNQDTLELAGYVGNINAWETSTDGGVSWGSISTSNATLPINNITNEVDVRIIVESQWGYCPNDTTAWHHIALDQLSYAGILPADFDICDNGNAGILQTTGFTSQIVDWLYSFDGGTTWQNQGHPYDTISYLNFTGDVQVMVSAINGTCPIDTSNVLNLTYIPGTQAGTLSGPTLACNWNNEGEIVSTGNYGDVVQWWYSIDSGATWTPSILGSGDSIYNFIGLTSSTWFSAEIKYGNCPSEFTTPHMITVKPVNVQITPDTTITQGDNIQLHASANGATGFSWWPDDFMNDPSSSDPNVEPEFTITYFVQITDLDGCKDTADVTVTVVPDISLLSIPNLITPNGDGYNDHWQIKNLEGFPEAEVTVFNIYGQIVYASAPYNNNWGGEYKGKQLPDGTYFYILDLKIPESDPEYLPPLQGAVTIAGND